ARRKKARVIFAAVPWLADHYEQSLNASGTTPDKASAAASGPAGTRASASRTRSSAAVTSTLAARPPRHFTTSTRWPSCACRKRTRKAAGEGFANAVSSRNSTVQQPCSSAASCKRRNATASVGGSQASTPELEPE